MQKGGVHWGPCEGGCCRKDMGSWVRMGWQACRGNSRVQLLIPVKLQVKLQVKLHLQLRKQLLRRLINQA